MEMQSNILVNNVLTPTQKTNFASQWVWGFYLRLNQDRSLVGAMGLVAIYFLGGQKWYYPGYT
jgi:hypothetical protein